MFDPRYKLSHSMLNNIVKFEVERKGILETELDEAVENEIRLYGNSTDIFHLGHLLGVNLTLKMAKKIASGRTLSIGDYRGKYLTNFRNAIEYILSTQSSYFPIQGNILIHLNKILIKTFAEEWDAKFRTGGEQLEDEENNWLSLRDEDIASVEVQSRALELFEWFNTQQTKVHALIRIPIVLYHLVRIAPFVRANKLTAITACKFLFYKSGYIVNGYFPAIKNFDVYEEEYIEAWKTAASERDDITLWIERFIRNAASEVVNLKGEIEKINASQGERNKQPFLDLNRRQLKILRYLQNIPIVKREEYVEIMDVSTMTAYRDLNELVKKGLLKIEGEGRGTRYMLTSR